MNRTIPTLPAEEIPADVFHLDLAHVEVREEFFADLIEIRDVVEIELRGRQQ